MAINHAHQYPQVVGTPSERSDRDLWNHINRYIWGKSGAESSPVGDWSAEPYAIRPLIDINTTQIKKNTEVLTQRELKKNKSLDKLSFCDRTAKQYLSDLDNILPTIIGHYIVTLNKDGNFNSKFTCLVKYHKRMIFGHYPSTRLFSNKPFKRNCKEITDY